MSLWPQLASTMIYFVWIWCRPRNWLANIGIVLVSLGSRFYSLVSFFKQFPTSLAHMKKSLRKDFEQRVQWLRMMLSSMSLFNAPCILFNLGAVSKLSGKHRAESGAFGESVLLACFVSQAVPNFPPSHEEVSEEGLRAESAMITNDAEFALIPCIWFV